MPRTEPISISAETHGLAGNLVLPDGATDAAPVPAALIVGGPGPLPLERYTKEGAKNWPVLWTEGLAARGVAGLCYDQRGSGLSSGLYHEADWDALYEDARAAADVLRLQPEVGKVVAVAWADGCAFALQLAAEGLVDGVVLLAPAYHTAEERYARSIRELASRKGLSERVIQLRISQWKDEILNTARRVQAGETTSMVDLGGTEVTTNLVRFLQSVAFDPAPVAAATRTPALLMHGLQDSAVLPDESAVMESRLGGPVHRITYPGQAHFLYRHSPAVQDAAEWILRTLA